jgi:hypothetical protein
VRSDRAEAIPAVKRVVNARHGRCALRSAATLALVGVYRDPSNEWDICDVRGKMCFWGRDSTATPGLHPERMRRDRGCGLSPGPPAG